MKKMCLRERQLPIRHIANKTNYSILQNGEKRKEKLCLKLI
nr:MAG TPA: hypothetical protein [Caudoviricetes sp.]